MSRRPLDPLDASPERRLPEVVVALMKGLVLREDDLSRFQALLHLQGRVRDHVAIMGLVLEVDESEGWAFLRQRPNDAAEDGEPELPRLVARRPLSFPVSLLLVLLRRRLAEFDASSGEARLVLRREEIAELMRLFLPPGTNEAKLLDKLDAHIDAVVKLGFLRPLKGSEDELEVVRILRAFVDAQWLQEFEARLAAYRAHAAGEKGDA